ncbi:MAG TPA: ABC transporter permease [Galbitalea sp.]
MLVLAVATLASTVVTSVGLLVSATELGAVQNALTSIAPAETAMSVNVSNPTVSISQARSRSDKAIDTVLGGAATATTSTAAYSDTYPAEPSRTAVAQVAYFGQLDGVLSHVKVVAGSWPNVVPPAGGRSVEVALPQTAASALGIKVGTSIPMFLGEHNVDVVVAAIYSVPAPQSDFWAQDILRGQGNNPGYVSPDGTSAVPQEAYGPLVVAPGALDAIGVRAARLEFDYAPHFAHTTPGQLAGLIDRLQSADSDVPSDVGAIADQVEYSGDAADPIGQVAAGLIVTRSTVVVVTLLLLVLSIAALAQAARLFTDARAGDRQLMGARGASRGQIFWTAVLEASFIGVITAVISPPLARGVYAIVALQPSMIAANAPRDAGLPPEAWLTSAGLAVLFVVVLVLPLIGPSTTFVDAEQGRGRQRRLSGIMRSGLDLGVVVLAALAYWQLVTYRGPVGGGASLSVDPVLAAAPAIVLLAAALIAARLIPLVSRLADRFGTRTRGALLPLASWEVGRRSQRAIAAVLLLTLALGVGTFGETFLATWQQSQVDQATVAAGAPVRVAADPAHLGSQASLLADGATGAPQPTLRRTTDVSQEGGSGEDSEAVTLGLTSASRAMLADGRVAGFGGSAIASLLPASAKPVAGEQLPGDPDGVSATVQLGTAGQQIAGVSATLRAVVQDATGLLFTVPLGEVPVDAAPHQVDGALDSIAKGGHRALPLQVVGVQVFVYTSNLATYRGNSGGPLDVLVKSIAATTGTEASPATTSAGAHWFANSLFDSGSTPVFEQRAGWQLGMSVALPADIQSGPQTFAMVAWRPLSRVPAVFSRGLATTLDVKIGADLVLIGSSDFVGVQVAGIVPLVPGSVDQALLTSGAASGAAQGASQAVVVDQVAYERSLVQVGASGGGADEWWVDVPADQAASYLKAHPAGPGLPAPRSAVLLGIQLQQNPLRVATEAALLLAIAAAALLAAIGFAVHSAATLKSRRVEFAQLRAIGLSRRRLTALIAAESLLLCVLGTGFGLAIGVLLSLMVGPLVAISPTGTTPVPPVEVIVPWAEVGLLVAVIAVVLAAVVTLVAGTRRFANPADILREADEG